MSYRIRAARTSDVDALYDLTLLTGGGFTNLPSERPTLEKKLARSAEGFARAEDSPGSDLYVFMLEDVASGEVIGTCQVFGAVGEEQPFYSYLISTLTQKSEELGEIFRNQTLNLTTDLEGYSEVGGLFLHPERRSGGLGLLLARSRYLFIRRHRQRFASHVLAELRGVMDENGNSPFWDAIGGRFFGMAFPEADKFNAVHGTQFIADLFPKTPIYIAMLPDSAREVIGQPHPTGRAALRMLQEEGFDWDCYVDIFDGGPTVTCQTDRIRTVRDAAEHEFAGIHEGDGQSLMVATGRLTEFKACHARGAIGEDGSIRLDPEAVAALEIEPGQTLTAVARP